jgi:hypothetical protein
MNRISSAKLRLRLTWEVTKIERNPEQEQSEESNGTEDAYKFSRVFHLLAPTNESWTSFAISALYAGNDLIATNLKAQLDNCRKQAITRFDRRLYTQIPLWRSSDAKMFTIDALVGSRDNSAPFGVTRGTLVQQEQSDDGKATAHL